MNYGINCTAHSFTRKYWFSILIEHRNKPEFILTREQKRMRYNNKNKDKEDDDDTEDYDDIQHIHHKWTKLWIERRCASSNCLQACDIFTVLWIIIICQQECNI